MHGMFAIIKMQEQEYQHRWAVYLKKATTEKPRNKTCMDCVGPQWHTISSRARSTNDAPHSIQIQTGRSRVATPECGASPLILILFFHGLSCDCQQLSLSLNNYHYWCTYPKFNSIYKKNICNIYISK